jgi:hypothetical protein
MKISLHQKNTPVVFRGVSVPANSIYGTIKAENYNFVFVSMPKMDSFDKMPFVFYQNGRIVKNIYSAMLEYAISQSVKSLANDGKITLTHWNHKAEQRAEMRIVERKNKRKSERKEWQEIRSAQKNRDSAGHKPSKHTKAMRAKPNFYTAEYNDLSKRIYGESIDMNGTVRRCRNRTAEYMDGSGLGKFRGDMRPLNPQMPLKSGRKAR